MEIFSKNVCHVYFILIFNTNDIHGRQYVTDKLILQLQNIIYKDKNKAHYQELRTEQEASKNPKMEKFNYNNRHYIETPCTNDLITLKELQEALKQM